MPILAAFAITQWDLVMDPPNATIGGAWIWHRGGGYFGVPLTNFVGWFLTTWLFFQIFALVAYDSRRLSSAPNCSRLFLAIPIVLYLASGLCHLGPLFDLDRQVVDGGGGVWSSAAIRETAAIMALLTMLPTSCFALARLTRRRAAEAALVD